MNSCNLMVQSYGNVLDDAINISLNYVNIFISSLKFKTQYNKILHKILTDSDIHSGDLCIFAESNLLTTEP